MTAPINNNVNPVNTNPSVNSSASVSGASPAQLAQWELEQQLLIQQQQQQELQKEQAKADISSQAGRRNLRAMTGDNKI